jgi:hypothetical protein
MIGSEKVAAPAKRKNSTVTQKHSPKRRGVSGSSGGALSTLYWMVFLVGVIMWGVLFGREFARFDSYADRVEKQVSSLADAVMGDEDVLGIEDPLSADDAVELEEPGGETISDESIAQVVDEIEEERKEKIRDVLSLELPSETDNPNYPVTFTEPTEEGVEIQVDGEGFSKKKSPYALPSLPIGQHTINFKFLDENEVTQNLEEKLIVIPRAPVWDSGISTQFDGDSPVVLSGTATPRSTVIVLVSSELFTVEAGSDKEGKWEATLTEELSSGEHTALSFVRKDGYASNFSEPFTFTVGNVEGAADSSDGTDDGPDGSDSASMLFGGFIDVNEDNYILILAGVGVAALVLLILVSLLSKLFSDPADSDEGWIEDIKENGKSPEGLSLREKFAQAGLKVGKEREEQGAGPDNVSDGTHGDTDGSERETDDDDDPEGSQDVPEDADDEDEETGEEVDDTDKESSPEKREDPIPEVSDEMKDGKARSSAEQGNEQSQPKKEIKPKPGKIYSKDEFMKTFKEPTTMGKETKKIKISLTSQDGK